MIVLPKKYRMVLTQVNYRTSQITDNYFDYYFEELKYFLAPLFDYKQGNCHNVTHYASLFLKSYGVHHDKIWIYAPTRYREDSKLTIQLPDPNNISPNGLLTWGYHVALFLQYAGEECVFDLFLDSKKPLSMAKWLEKMQARKFRVDIENPDNYLFYTKPSETKKNGLFTGQYFKYDGICREQNWLAKGLAINETAINFYKNEYFHLKYKTPLSTDYKLFVGRVNNLECVLRDNKINKKMTEEFQQKHANMIAMYRLVYARNLEKWIEKAQTFL
jgi:hypothetical protein